MSTVKTLKRLLNECDKLYKDSNNVWYRNGVESCMDVIEEYILNAKSSQAQPTDTNKRLKKLHPEILTTELVKIYELLFTYHKLGNLSPTEKKLLMKVRQKILASLGA